MRLAWMLSSLLFAVVLAACPETPPPITVEGEGEGAGEGEGEDAGEGEGDAGEGEGEDDPDGRSCAPLGSGGACPVGYACVSPTLEATGACRKSCIVDDGSGQGTESPGLCDTASTGTTCQTQLVVDARGVLTATAAVCLPPVTTVDTACFGVLDPDSCAPGLTCSFMDFDLPGDDRQLAFVLQSECKVACGVGDDFGPCRNGEVCGRAAADLFIRDFEDDPDRVSCEFAECNDAADARCDCDRAAGFECVDTGSGGVCARVQGYCATPVPTADEETADLGPFRADAELLCGYRDGEHKACDDTRYRDLDVAPPVRCTADFFGPDWLTGGLCYATCRQDTRDFNDDGRIAQDERAFVRDCPTGMVCSDAAGGDLGFFAPSGDATDCVLRGCTLGEECAFCGAERRCLSSPLGLPVCGTTKSVCVDDDAVAEGEGEGEAGEGEGEGPVGGEGEGEGPVGGEGEGEGEGPVVDGSAGCGTVNVDQANGVQFLYPVTLTVDGRARTYGVRFPSGYDNRRPYPVVLVFHGDQNCQTFNTTTGECDVSRLPGSETRGLFKLEGPQSDAQSNLADDAIVVYVDGRNLNRFEPQTLSWDTFARADVNPDMRFVDAVLRDVEADLCVDASRTFAVGFSGGAFFVDSLACYRGGFTAIATFEGGFEDGDLEVSKDAANVVDLAACVADAPAALVVHAEADATVPLRYGTAAAEHWRTENGCVATTTPAPELDTSGQNDCVSFDGCADGDDVALCTPVLADPLQGDQHNIWRPEGPRAVATFFRSFF